jgi:hypothetical protein
VHAARSESGPEELASLNFEQMDTDLGIGTFHMECRAKAVNTFSEWALTDFKKTSTLSGVEGAKARVQDNAERRKHSSGDR